MIDVEQLNNDTRNHDFDPSSKLAKLDDILSFKHQWRKIFILTISMEVTLEKENVSKARLSEKYTL